MSSVLIGYNVKIIISRREKKLTTGFFSIRSSGGELDVSIGTPLATVFLHRVNPIFSKKNPLEKLVKIRIRS
jgi:hypothetical protein